MQSSTSKSPVDSSIQVTSQNPIIQQVANTQRNGLLTTTEDLSAINGIDPNKEYNYPPGTICFDLLQNFSMNETLVNIDRFSVPSVFAPEPSISSSPFPEGRCTFAVNVTTDPGVGVMVFNVIDKFGKDQTKWFEDLYTGAGRGKTSVQLFTDLHTIQITKEGQTFKGSTFKQLTMTGKVERTEGFMRSKGDSEEIKFTKAVIYHMFVETTDIFNTEVSKDQVIDEVKKLNFKSICLPGYIIQDDPGAT